MNKIRVDLPSTHNNDMTYHFTEYQLKKFRRNVVLSQTSPVNSRIACTSFGFTNEYIYHYDGVKFKGGSFDIPTRGVLKILDDCIKENCKST